MLLTFSEFGRRVAQNASNGTDHGAAAPLFLFGGALQGGLIGKHPSLTQLHRGDLVHHTDFPQRLRHVAGSMAPNTIRAGPRARLR
jgi:uncharacterized protein (DUF1501 family)